MQSHATHLSIYTVTTRSGITYRLEASSWDQAWTRARDPIIAAEIARMMGEALRDIASVEPFRGPSHIAGRRLVFSDGLFCKT